MPCTSMQEGDLFQVRNSFMAQNDDSEEKNYSREENLYKELHNEKIIKLKELT